MDFKILQDRTVFSSPCSLLNSTVFALAYFIVRIAYNTYSIQNVLIDNSRLLVIQFWGRQKSNMDFQMHGQLAPPKTPYCSRVNCIYNYGFTINDTTQEQPNEEKNKVRSGRVPNTELPCLLPVESDCTYSWQVFCSLTRNFH